MRARRLSWVTPSTYTEIDNFGYSKVGAADMIYALSGGNLSDEELQYIVGEAVSANALGTSEELP
jgi:hypothetical protein